MTQTTYIARHICPIDEYGSQKAFFECAFSSYKKALNYIKRESKEYSKQDLLSHGEWYFEIVEYKVDNLKPWKNCKIWYFDILGKLIAEKDYSKEEKVSNDSPDSFTGKFKIGDIVFVRSTPGNKSSCHSLNIFGVIHSTPVPFDEWNKKKKNDKNEGWDNQYIILYIRQDGILDHTHIEEKAITSYLDKLPKEKKYLKPLSKLLKGKYKFKKKLWSEIHTEGVIFQDIRVINASDFEKV